MTYRDDLEAASERAAALERELAEAKAENERLKRSASMAEPERAAREALARDGRGRKDLEHHWQEVRAAKIENLPKEHQRWLRIASSRFGFTRYGWFYYGLPFLILFPSILLAMLFGEKRMPAILGGTLGAAWGVIQIGLFATYRAGERTKKWLVEQPFPITGFAECFEDGATGHHRVAVYLDYQDGSPGLEKLQAFVGDGAEVDEDGRRLRVLISTSKSALQSNREQYKVMRRMVDGVLAPLHREYPLIGVRFQANG